LMVFFECVRVLRRKRLSHGPTAYLAATAGAIFILVTCHLSVDISRNMDAFTSNMAVPNYALTYYHRYDTFKNMFKSGTYVGSTVVQDAFMLYRCFIVWRSYLVTILPFLLFLADIGVGILWTYTLSLVKPGEDIWDDALSVRVKAFFAITFSFNVICTLLISYRIWRIQSKVSRYGQGTRLTRVIIIIVESGAVYSICLIALIACITSGTPGMFVVLNCTSPIIGIVFSSVIIRVGSGVSMGDPTVQSSGQESTSTRRNPRSQYSSNTYHPEGVQISLQKTVHTITDDIPDDMSHKKEAVMDV